METNNEKESTTLWLFSLPKQSRVALLFSAMAFSFSLLLLVPLDLYLNNASDFNIGLTHACLPLLIIALLLFSAIVLLAPLVFGGKYVDIFTIILCGITLACYVQVLFLNGDMAELTGDTGHYKDSIMNTFNVLAWLSIVILPLNLLAFIRSRERFKQIKWETGIITVSIIILGMQTSGVFTAVLKYEPVNAELPHYVSYDKTFELSSNENICVFIFDRLDVLYMDEVLVKYPALIEQLDGFTYYRNNVSEFTGTFTSTTRMFTPLYYDFNDKRPKFFKKAWGEYTFIDKLNDNGIVTTLLLSKGGTYGDASQLKDRAKNIVPADVLSIDYKYNEIIKTTLKISFSRLSPYITKEFFIGEILADFSNTFVEMIFEDDKLSESYMTGAVGNKTDIQFFNRLKTIGLSTPYVEGVFTVAHFMAAHDGKYHYNEQTNSLEKGGSRIDSAHGSFAILNEYFKQMKELGIYDDAQIIIISDHGRWLASEEMRSGLNKPASSALFIKPKNEHGALEINNTAQLSHINFQASILEMAGIPHEDYGFSYYDIINGSIEQTRKLNWPFFSRTNNASQALSHYFITGDASDINNWVYIPVYDTK